MSDFKYEYENKFVVNAPRSEVLDNFFDYSSYPKWQTSLQNVILEQGSSREEGRVVTLVFGGPTGQTMRMTETIASLHLPHKVVMEYNMGTTINLDTHYFDHFGAKTVWTVHTEFFFASQPGQSVDVFKQATKRGYEAFVTYIEDK